MRSSPCGTGCVRPSTGQTGDVSTPTDEVPLPSRRRRMSGQQRRDQLVDVARRLFAQRGFEAVSVEQIAAAADVSKPVVYEHFGGKEGIYAVIVDREVTAFTTAMTPPRGLTDPRLILEGVALAMLTYIETSTDGFRILVRDSPAGMVQGSFASTIQDVTDNLASILSSQFSHRGFSKRLAPIYAHMLVGMAVQTGQWWVDVRKPSKEVVAAHLVNLAWHGFEHLEKKPRLSGAGG